MATYDSTVRLRQLNKPELSGYITEVIGEIPDTGNLTGIFYPLNSNPSNFIIPDQTGVFATKDDLNTNYYNTLLYVGNTYYQSSNPSGYISSLPSSIVYATGNQGISGLKNFSTRPTVNGTGILLYGEASNNDANVKDVVYTSGNQDITGNKNFKSGLSTSNLTSNSSTLSLSGNSGARIEFYNNSYITGFSEIHGAQIYENGIRVATAADLEGILGFDIQNVVYKTGNQTISGEKTFLNKLKVGKGSSEGVFEVQNKTNIFPSIVPNPVVHGNSNRIIFQTFDLDFGGQGSYSHIGEVSENFIYHLYGYKNVNGKRIYSNPLAFTGACIQREGGDVLDGENYFLKFTWSTPVFDENNNFITYTFYDGFSILVLKDAYYGIPDFYKVGLIDIPDPEIRDLYIGFDNPIGWSCQGTFNAQGIGFGYYKTDNFESPIEEIRSYLSIKTGLNNNKIEINSTSIEITGKKEINVNSNSINFEGQANFKKETNFFDNVKISLNSGISPRGIFDINGGEEISLPDLIGVSYDIYPGLYTVLDNYSFYVYGYKDVNGKRIYSKPHHFDIPLTSTNKGFGIFWQTNEIYDGYFILVDKDLEFIPSILDGLKNRVKYGKFISGSINDAVNIGIENGPGYVSSLGYYEVEENLLIPYSTSSGLGNFYLKTGLSNSQIIMDANLIQISGNSIEFKKRPTVSGIGVLLENQSVTTVIKDVVYTTGDQTISGIKSFYSRPKFGTGISATGILLSGEVSGSNLIGGGSGIYYNTSNNTLNFKTLKAGSGLRITGDNNNLTFDVTGSFGTTISNLENFVYTTGDQIINGNKTFNNIYITGSGFLYKNYFPKIQFLDLSSQSFAGTAYQGNGSYQFTIYGVKTFEGEKYFSDPTVSNILSVVNPNTYCLKLNWPIISFYDEYFITVNKDPQFTPPINDSVENTNYGFYLDKNINFIGIGEQSQVGHVFALGEPLTEYTNYNSQDYKNKYYSQIYGTTGNLILKSAFLQLSGQTYFDQRPKVNGTGILLDGEALITLSNVVYITGNQTIDGKKHFLQETKTDTLITNWIINNDDPYHSQIGSYSNYIGTAAGFIDNAANNSYSNFIGFLAGGPNNGLNQYSNFIGFGAGNAMFDCSHVNFLGFGAGYQANNADYSNFIGANAGAAILGTETNNSESNFIGYSAGYGATNCSISNFIGKTAGENSNGSERSNFIGHYAGRDTNALNYSNIIGDLAGYKSKNCNYSNFIGSEAGAEAEGCAYSIFIGQKAGFQSIGVSNSIFIGKLAGTGIYVDEYSSVANSILIGNHTSTNGFSSSISIGQGTANSANKQFNIGNVLYGINIRDEYSPSSNPISTGKVGILIDNPQYTLDVSGDCRISGNLIIGGSGIGFNSFVTTGQTGSFITSGQTGRFVTTGDTGNFITKITGFNSGFSLFSGTFNNAIVLRSISGVSGVNISFNNNSGALLLSVTGLATTGISSLGSGFSLFSGITQNNSIAFRSISGNTGINISLNSGVLYFNTTGLVYTNGNQTINGIKTFETGVVLNGILSGKNIISENKGHGAGIYTFSKILNAGLGGFIPAVNDIDFFAIFSDNLIIPENFPVPNGKYFDVIINSDKGITKKYGVYHQSGNAPIVNSLFNTGPIGNLDLKVDFFETGMPQNGTGVAMKIGLSGGWSTFDCNIVSTVFLAGCTRKVKVIEL